MKHNYTVLLFTLLFGMFSTQAQDLTFTFANAVITTDGANDFYEADIMIASTSDFIVGSGLLYFNYNNAAFGTNISDGGTVEVTYPSPDYICGDVDAVIGGVVAAYGSFVQNDNTASRFAFSFQQAISSGAMAGNNVTSTPTKLFHLKIQYVDSAIDPMMSFEGNSPFDDQFFTACGPVAVAFALADCSGEPGMLLNDTFDSSNSTPATLSVENFTFQDLKVYPNPASDVINITATQTIDSVEIYNLLGKKVLASTTGNNTLNVSQLTSGIYVINITSSLGNISKKLIID